MQFGFHKHEVKVGCEMGFKNAPTPKYSVSVVRVGVIAAHDFATPADALTAITHKLTEHFTRRSEQTEDIEISNP